MSKRVPGYSQQEMIALWKGFVQSSFRRTGFRTSFNGKDRAVFQDRTRLLILDEYHGDLEVLSLQVHSGEAQHLGSQEIDVSYDLSPSGRATVREIKLGAYRPGAKHKFILTGRR
jgi:hypothetical protein